MPIGVNLRSNPVRDCCLTIKSRSPLAPIRSGGQEYSQSPPLLKGDLGGYRSQLKTRFIKAFRLKLTLMGSAVSLQCYFR